MICCVWALKQQLTGLKWKTKTWSMCLVSCYQAPSDDESSLPLPLLTSDHGLLLPTMRKWILMQALCCRFILKWIEGAWNWGRVFIFQHDDDVKHNKNWHVVVSHGEIPVGRQLRSGVWGSVSSHPSRSLWPSLRQLARKKRDELPKSRCKRFVETSSKWFKAALL